jgi:hypothetical protein
MSLDDYKLIGPVAYRGKEGCRSVVCTRRTDDSRCFGWHCTYCDEPTSYQGHRCPAAEAILGESERLAKETL